MGEIVQKSLEELIPVLENLERVQLFSSKEIRLIVRKCKDFEYKLSRKEKGKRDFVAYIEYLINFRSLIFQRRKLAKYWHKKQEIDQITCRKIDQLFHIACSRYKSDLRLWLSRIHFVKKRKMYFNVSRIFLATLQIHSDKANLWVLAAKYEFEEQGNPDNSRSILQRGLRFLPKSKKIWLELFRFELLFVERILKRKTALMSDEDNENNSTSSTEQEDLLVEGKLAIVVFNQAMSEVKDSVEFCLQFIAIAKQFPFAKSILDEIYNYLNDNFDDKEERWQALIDKTLDECLSSIDKDDKEIRSTKKEIQQIVQDCEKRCIETYKRAVIDLNTAKMWRMYLTFCLQRHDELCDDSLKSQKVEEIYNLFVQVSTERDVLDESLYIKWLDYCKSTEEKSFVLSTAVKNAPKSLHLWKEYLHFMTSSMEYSKKSIRKLFSRAIGCVLDKASLNCCLNVSTVMKIRYLEYRFTIATDMKSVFELFRELSSMKPNSIEFYETYIRMEFSSSNPNANHIRECFESAIDECGSDNVDIWLQYATFELKSKDGKPEKASKILERAKQYLKPDLHESLVLKNLMTSQCYQCL